MNFSCTVHKHFTLQKHNSVYLLCILHRIWCEYLPHKVTRIRCRWFKTWISEVLKVLCSPSVIFQGLKNVTWLRSTFKNKRAHTHTNMFVHTLLTRTYLSLPPNCTFFVAAVASVFPERQKGGENKQTEKGHKSKRKKKKKSHMTLWRMLMIKTNIHRHRVVHYGIQQVEIVWGVYFGWVFVILFGGLGNGEWGILIKAFCLLPLVYWDATRQKGKTDITCRNISLLRGMKVRHNDFIPNGNYMEDEWSDTCFQLHFLNGSPKLIYGPIRLVTQLLQMHILAAMHA